MTDLVSPGEAWAAADSRSTGHAIWKAGTGGWVVSGVDIANRYTELDETQLNGFAFNPGATVGTDLVFDAGEAYVAGWLCRDRQTTVSVGSNESIDIWLGWDASAVLADGQTPLDNDNVILGTADVFDSDDPRIRIYTVDMAGGVVDGDPTDHRTLQQPLRYTTNGELVAAVDLVVEGNVQARDGNVVVSGSEYEIQKDGVDAAGVINFKTE